MGHRENGDNGVENAEHAAMIKGLWQLGILARIFEELTLERWSYRGRVEWWRSTQEGWLEG